jgi:transposase
MEKRCKRMSSTRKRTPLEARTISEWIVAPCGGQTSTRKMKTGFQRSSCPWVLCGVIQGRGWRNNPLKSGVARTSPSRLILELAKTYAGRLEIDFVTEHGTSVSCPCCNKKLSPFRGDNLVFPTEGYGKRLRSINRRNGRVCEDVLCSWGRSCENRDVIGAINMLRRFYKVYEDLAYSNDEDERQRGESHGY